MHANHEFTRKHLTVVVHVLMFTYIMRFLLHNWQRFLFECSRPVSTAQNDSATDKPVDRFLLHSWRVFLFDFSRPVTFRCTRTVSICGKWNYLNVLHSAGLVGYSSWETGRLVILICHRVSQHPGSLDHCNCTDNKLTQKTPRHVILYNNSTIF